MTNQKLHSVIEPAFAGYAEELLSFASGAAAMMRTYVTDAALTEWNATVEQNGPNYFVYKASGVVDVWLAFSTGEWVHQSTVTVSTVTSKGWDTARSRLGKYCDEAAAKLGTDYRGVRGTIKIVGTTGGINDKQIFEAPCLLQKNIPHCINEAGHPYPDCGYAPGYRPLLLRFSKRMKCTLREPKCVLGSLPLWTCFEPETLGTADNYITIDSGAWNDNIVDMVVEAYARHYAATYDGAFVANLAERTSGAMNAAEGFSSNQSVRYEGPDANGGGRSLFRCGRHARDYSQFCHFNGDLSASGFLPSTVTAAAQTFDLTEAYENAVAYRGLIPHGRLRVAWADAPECWSKTLSNELWVSTESGDRILSVIPGTRQDDNVFDSSLLREDGLQLWTLQRGKERTVFRFATRVGEGQTLQLPFGPATRLPNACKLTAAGPSLYFDVTDISYDLDEIRRDIDYLTVIRSQQAQIFDLTQKGHQTAMCAVAHMIDVVQSLEMTYNLDDLSQTSKSKVVSMISLAEQVGALPVLDVPLLVDAFGEPITDPFTGDPLPDYDALALSGYVNATPALNSPITACAEAKDEDAVDFVQIDNRIHELLTFAWALALASSDEGLLAEHLEWTVSNATEVGRE